MIAIAKEGDELKLVADYTFGMPHDKWRIATLQDPIYIYVKGSTEYTAGTCYALIKSVEGKPYSMITDNEQIVGFEIIKK